MTFTDSNLDPQHYQSPKCFVPGCAHTQILLDRHTHGTTSHKKYLWRPRRHVCIRYYTYSVRRPLGVCSFVWMVVIIFGLLARGEVTMETTKQWSHQQACYITEGGTLAGKTEGVHRMCGQNPFPLARPAGLSCCMPAGSLGWLACSPLSALLVGVSPMCGLCVSPSLSVSGQPLLAVWVLAKLILGSL